MMLRMNILTKRQITVNYHVMNVLTKRQTHTIHIYHVYM